MEFYEIQDFSPFLDKMRRGELTLEEILVNDSIIDDLKSRENSEFLEFLINRLFYSFSKIRRSLYRL